ncbi:MAG: hypothetical protein KJN68_01860 [Bacteroidia bacterium]|nr:hypothetical protein [Bacteroidia bacterium]
MDIKRLDNALDLGNDWDSLSSSVIQGRSFLKHLEKTNHCHQRYYVLTRDNQITAGAIVYSLGVNLLTFSKRKLALPMQIIGIPLSCDISGVIGKGNDVNVLISHILTHEKGILLCLNHNQKIAHPGIIQLRTLPSMILNRKHSSWQEYLEAVRFPYRRRIKSALRKSDGIQIKQTSCHLFSDTHYKQYLQVVRRSVTKLEILKLDFFRNLNPEFKLNSFYKDNDLLYWNISVEDGDDYSFLFGGLDYEKRDYFDSYINNLITILQNGYQTSCKQFNLGQTAEIAKARFGAIPLEKSMFLFHKNPLARWVFRKMSGVLSYSQDLVINNVYKKEPIKTLKLKDHINYAKSV